MRTRKVFVLLIEDNPADAGLVREALDEHDIQCELHNINDGESAIAFIEAIGAQGTRCPDLVILDLNLPRKSGTEVLRSIRANGNCGHIPIVILTSSDSQKDKDETAAAGASQYIQKPSRLSDFLDLGRVFEKLLRSSSH